MHVTLNPVVDCPTGDDSTHTFDVITPWMYMEGFLPLTDPNLIEGSQTFPSSAATAEDSAVPAGIAFNVGYFEWRFERVGAATSTTPP
jgi:hypothetical protein